MRLQKGGWTAAPGCVKFRVRRSPCPLISFFYYYLRTRWGLVPPEGASKVATLQSSGPRVRKCLFECGTLSEKRHRILDQSKLLRLCSPKNTASCHATSRGAATHSCLALLVSVAAAPIQPALRSDTGVCSLYASRRCVCRACVKRGITLLSRAAIALQSRRLGSAPPYP